MRPNATATYRWGYMQMMPVNDGGFVKAGNIAWFRTRKQVYAEAHKRIPPQPYAVVRFESSGR